MRLFIRLTAIIAYFTVAALGAASPEAYADADAIAAALPWANANPYAAAAAKAYANSYAEALSLGHPDPEAYAMAASADQCADIGCHATCGLMIIEGQKCSLNTTTAFWGPHNTTCLCEPGSRFLSYYPGCMNCGWTLWKYYGGYVTDALRACSTLSTEPTGTSRCSTTLTDEYTPDWGIDPCIYTGGCTTSSSSSSSISLRNTLTDTTYTAETFTVTTDMSYHYQFTPADSIRICSDVSRTVSFDDQFQFTSTFWNEQMTDPISGNVTHKTYGFINFTQDYDDITDIQLWYSPSPTSTEGVIIPDSYMYTNLRQGIFVMIVSEYHIPLLFGKQFLIVKGGTRYLTGGSCSEAVFNSIEIVPEYDFCERAGSASSRGPCFIEQKPADFVYEFRPFGDNPGEEPTSELSEIESSSENEPSSEIESSSEIEPSSEIESSSENEPSSEIEPSSESDPSSESQPSSESEPSSIQSSTTDTTIEESSQDTTSVEDSTSDLQSTTSSSDAQSTSEESTTDDETMPQPSAQLSFTGEALSGNTASEWTIVVPGTLGPWSSIDFAITKGEVNNTFDYSEAEVTVNGEVSTLATTSVAPDAILISLVQNISEEDTVGVRFGAELRGGNSWTANARIVINTIEDMGLLKREEIVYELSSTITGYEEGDGEEESHEEVEQEESNTGAVTVTSGLSTNITISSSSDEVKSSLDVTDSALVTSTKSTEGAVRTTVITVTACDHDDVCRESIVTTGVTVVVTTSEGVVTSYTTYCPIESHVTKTVSADSTTVVTITSCEKHVCFEKTVTTGVAIVTKDKGGKKTTETNYVALETVVTETIIEDHVTKLKGDTTRRGDGATVESKVVETKVEGSQTIITTRTVTSTLAEASGTNGSYRATVDEETVMVTGAGDVVQSSASGADGAVPTQVVVSQFDGGAVGTMGSALTAMLIGILLF